MSRDSGSVLLYETELETGSMGGKPRPSEALLRYRRGDSSVLDFAESLAEPDQIWMILKLFNENIDRPRMKASILRDELSAVATALLNRARKMTSLAPFLDEPARLHSIATTVASTSKALKDLISQISDSKPGPKRSSSNQLFVRLWAAFKQAGASTGDLADWPAWF